MSFVCTTIKNHFHTKGFTLTPALKCNLGIAYNQFKGGFRRIQYYRFLRPKRVFQPRIDSQVFSPIYYLHPCKVVGCLKRLHDTGLPNGRGGEWRHPIPKPSMEGILNFLKQHSSHYFWWLQNLTT